MLISDRLFYLLAVLFAAALIAVSVRYWPGQDYVTGPFSGAPEDGLVVSGQQLGVMQAAQGLTAQIMEEDGVAFLRTAAGQSPTDGGRSAGVFLTLPETFSAAYAKTTIEITMILRGAGPDPSPKVSLAYYAPGRGNSRRTKCVLTGQWQPCTMRYQPPPAGEKNSVDYLGLWPDLDGLSRTADILEVRVMPAGKSALRALE